MKLCEDPPFEKNAKGRGTRRLFPLPTHWATLEDNDDVERMEKEPFDIKKMKVVSLCCGLGSFMHPRPAGAGGKGWVIVDSVDSRRAMEIFPLPVGARTGHPRFPCATHRGPPGSPGQRRRVCSSLSSG